MNLTFTFDEELARIKTALDLQLRQGQVVEELLEKIMSIVSEHVAAMGPQLQRIEENTNAIIAEVNRLREQGGLSPSDQEALAAQLARTTALANMVPPVPSGG